MNDPLFCYASDNLVTAANVTGSLTPVAGYAYSALADGDPANACRFTTANGRLVADCGVAVCPQIIAFFHHNRPSTQAVTVQAHTADSWATPDITDSPAYTPFAASLEPDGYRVDAWIDRRGKTATKQFWSAAFDDFGNAFALGEWFMSSTLRTFPGNFGFLGGESFGAGADVQTLEQQTDGGVSFRVRRGFRREVLAGQTICSWAESLDVIDFFKTLGGRAEPLLLIPYPDKEPGLIMLCLLDQDSIRRTSVGGDGFQITVNFRQLSRGLPWA